MLSTKKKPPEEMTAEEMSINEEVIKVLNQIGLLELMKMGVDQFDVTPKEVSLFEDMCDEYIMDILSKIDGTEVDTQFTLKVAAATEDFLAQIRAKK